jgi:hypothetical protein
LPVPATWALKVWVPPLATVAAGETAASLTVRAASTVDAGKSGAASVTIAVAGEQNIPSFTYNNSGLVNGDVMDMSCSVNGTIIAGILDDDTIPKDNTMQSTNRQYEAYGKYFNWLYDMQTQSKNLETGYAAVAGVYSEFEALKNGETSITNAIGGTNNVGTYITNAKGHFDTILDGILGDTGETRADFDKYYNAYTAGMYYGQKARNKSGSLPAYESALAQTEFNGQGIGALSALRGKLLSAINTALGTGDMTNTGNKAKAEELNGHFITQIGDLHELQAIMDDLNSLNFNNDIVNPITAEPSTINEIYNYFVDNIFTAQNSANSNKASHLTNGFDPNKLKGIKGKDGIEIA